MRKFYDIELGTSGGGEPKEYFEKVSGDVPPPKEGTYITNFGSLEWNGTTFVMNGHKRFPTSVDWWMTPFKP